MEQYNDVTKKSGLVMPLLPMSFKTIGIAILLATFLPFVFVKLKFFTLEDSQIEILKYLGVNSLIFGMLLIALSRNKKENDHTVLMRLKSIAFAFFLAIFSLVFKPLADLILGMPVIDMTGQSIVFSMLVAYFLIFSLQKKDL